RRHRRAAPRDRPAGVRRVGVRRVGVRTGGATNVRGPERIGSQVLVVGAGPAGSTAAYHLARQGVDGVMVEKAGFPREKVCGDGLTPRAVRHLVRMGIDTSAPGWSRNRGLRFVSRGVVLEVDWPESGSFPGYGLTRTRHDFDRILAERAVAAGAVLHTGTK